MTNSFTTICSIIDQSTKEFEKSQMKISSSVEGASKALACMRTNMSTQTTFSLSLFCAYILYIIWFLSPIGVS